MLRHYDALGLVQPGGRSVGGYREYSAQDVRRIFLVESLRSLGLSLQQVKRALEDPCFEPSAVVGDLTRWSQDRLRREQELLDRLRVIDASAPGDWQDVLGVVGLMRALSSTSAVGREQAVLASAQGGPVAVEVLVAAVLEEADPVVAGALHWALARSGGDEAVAGLAAAAGSPNVEVRRRAVLAIAEMPSARGAIEVLTDALDDPDLVVRDRAAVILGEQGVVVAVPGLVRMVTGGRDDVGAAEVLGLLSRDEGCAGVIVAVLSEELALAAADPSVRVRVAQALVEVQGEAAVSLLRRLTEDPDPVVSLVVSSLMGVR